PESIASSPPLRAMASASYKEDLTCSICLTIFSDPVILPCGHSFCRECISLSLKSQRQCPQCRADVPEDDLKWRTRLSLWGLMTVTCSSLCGRRCFRSSSPKQSCCHSKMGGI
uniref:RING-type domain-containing protein n=1 Tax=Scophthalmus maximus TaxID=52904 RepID=A0A8D3CUS1_SCOMX